MSGIGVEHTVRIDGGMKKNILTGNPNVRRSGTDRKREKGLSWLRIKDHLGRSSDHFDETSVSKNAGNSPTTITHQSEIFQSQRNSLTG
jgi:hypothetical protein